MTATAPPAEGPVHLALDVRRRDLERPVEARDLDDGTNGLLHLPCVVAGAVRADLALSPGAAATFAAGALPDGRPLALEVRLLP